MGAVSVTVRDERSPGRPSGELELSLDPRTTLRDLIRTRIREEVARYNSSPGEWFNGLVRPTDAEEDANGYRLRKPRRLDWERQAQVAEEAFGRNGFFVISATGRWTTSARSSSSRPRPRSGSCA